MNIVSKIFKNKKSLPLNTFIDKALYNQSYGYYSSKNPLGARGDFLTAPLISELFGEMLGIWCVSFWEKLGSPNKIIICELGPGDGSLCSTLINVFSKFKSFNAALEIKLLEKSKFLKKIQRNKITSSKVKWIKNINKIKSGPIIFIANEFFDSLPIKQFFFKNGIWYERHIKYLDKKKLIFHNKKTSNYNLKNLINWQLTKNQKIVEFPIESIRYLKSLSKIIKKYNGGMICFDYGYKKSQMSDSLQSIKKHKFSNLLLNVGESDITHHVNFGLFSKIIKELGLQLERIAEQGIFLKRMGIIQRANVLTKNINFKNKANIYYRLKRLIDPNEMGQLFKVFFFKKKGIRFSLGFK